MEKESIVTFQVAATHDMGNQLANGGNLRIRFRYRGISPNPATEIWRKREVALKIVRVKGPRISSLSFRSDLIWGSAYSELCAALAQQKAEHERIKIPAWNAAGKEREPTDGSDDSTLEKSILNRVGVDQGVHVCSDDIVVLMAVANETNSTIVLSNRKGLVGGFEGSPMPTVRVTSGVSVKIPVVIPRIQRINKEEGGAVDVVAALVQDTALQWESVRDDIDPTGEAGSSQRRQNIVDGAAAPANRKVRKGRVRIPSRCLREIISEHHSFVSRICTPPVTISLKVGGQECSHEFVEVSPGSPVDLFVEVETEDWVPAEVSAKCDITMEFCCARKGDTGDKFLMENSQEDDRRTYVWCGLVRQTVRATAAEKKHRARIAFLEDGAFVVSACARISKDGSGREETWLASLAQNVTVTTTKQKL